ncbi:MAG: FMN-binding protein [Candidatus Cloacimonetes bacterium]|nr:FMN-binding protein [Candidatus Cloacimonadota bacterium]
MKKSLIIFMIIPVLIYGTESAKDRFMLMAKDYSKGKKIEYHEYETIPYAVFIGNDQKKTYFFASEYIIKVKGYSGNTNLALEFDTQQKIQTIAIISSQDTPAFIRKIERSTFLSQFTKSNEIQLVSGASISCKAIKQIVKEVQRKADSIILLQSKK